MKRKRTPSNVAKAAYHLILALSGVYSVFVFLPNAAAYPLSTNIETVRITRSARETPPARESKPSRETKPSRPPVSSPMAPGSHNVSLGLGQNFLLGDLGNTYENALGMQLHYNYGVSDLFAFDSDFGYSTHSSGNFSMWHLAAGLRTNLVYLDQLVPYFNIGLGFYHPSYTYSPAANNSASGLLFGLQLSAGLDLFPSNSVFFRTSLTFHDMFSSTKTVNGVSKDLGGSFMSFMLHAGYAF